MRALAHLRTHGNEYWHAHPMHTAFSLIASLLLAGVVVLALVMSAK